MKSKPSTGSELNKITYHKCEGCGFNMRDNETHCQNCGKPKLKIPIDVMNIAIYVISGFVFFLVFFLNAAIFKYNFVGETSDNFLYNISISFYFSFFLFIILFIANMNLKKTNDHNYNMIEDRLIKLRDNMNKRLARMNEFNTPAVNEKASEITEKIGSSINAIKNQIAIYKSQIWHIEQIRWQNKIEPIVYQWMNYSFEEGERKIKELEPHIEQGKDMLTAWKNSEYINTDAIQERVREFGNIIDAADLLKQELMSQQALRAVMDVSPLETKLESVQQQEMTDYEPNQLVSRIKAITEISTTVEQLEIELRRIEDEDKHTDLIN